MEYFLYWQRRFISITYNLTPPCFDFYPSSSTTLLELFFTVLVLDSIPVISMMDTTKELPTPFFFSETKRMDLLITTVCFNFFYINLYDIINLNKKRPITVLWGLLSLNWFCLRTEYIFKLMYRYRPSQVVSQSLIPRKLEQRDKMYRSREPS